MKRLLSFMVMILVLGPLSLCAAEKLPDMDLSSLYREFIQNPGPETRQFFLDALDTELESTYFTSNTAQSAQKKELLLQIKDEVTSYSGNFASLSVLVCDYFSLQSASNQRAQYFYNELVICDIIIFALMAILFILYSQTKVKFSKSRWLTQQSIETQEEERRHISAELHDTVCQNLKCASLQLADGLAKDLVNTSISQVRQVCYNLTPPDIDNHDLASAILLYSQNFTQKYAITCDVVFSDARARETLNALDSTLQMHVFRIVQEALTNSAKHAGDHCTTCVLCNMHENRLNVFITDNGKGFDVKEASKATHFGLMIMKQRADFVNATLEISSELESGTTVHLRWDT